MIKLAIEEKLKERNKSIYWLMLELGLTYDNTYNMVKGRTKSIKFEVLEKLCYVFDCSFNDLFVFVDEKG